jgi:hypothetical protein
MKTINTIELITEKYTLGATGALFLLDDRQRMVQIYFCQGEISFIRSRNVSGLDAMTELSGMKPIKFQFHEGTETYETCELPCTKDIIDILSEVDNDISQKHPIPDNLENKARELFISYVGPIAEVIFEEQIGKKHSLDKLIQTLSSYIDNDGDKRAFIDAVRSLT